MASFPNSVKSFTTKNAGDVIQPADVNDLQDEVNAIEAGYINGTAPLNSSHSTLAALSVTGNSTLASSVTLGTIPYIFPASGASTGAVLTCVSTSGSTMTLGWSTPVTSQMSLIGGSSGSDSNAGAANVATFAISGLTNADVIKVIFSLYSAVAATSYPRLVSATDANGVVSEITTSGQSITGGEAIVGQALIAASPLGSTAYTSVNTNWGGTLGARTLGNNFSATTAWTGSWTLAFRHGGVTAGGTLKYTVNAFKIAGQ